MEELRLKQRTFFKLKKKIPQFLSTRQRFCFLKSFPTNSSSQAFHDDFRDFCNLWHSEVIPQFQCVIRHAHSSNEPTRRRLAFRCSTSIVLLTYKSSSRNSEKYFCIFDQGPSPSRMFLIQRRYKNVVLYRLSFTLSCLTSHQL